MLRPPPGSVLTSPQTAQVSFPGYAIDSPPFVERWPGEAPVEVEGELRRSAYGGVYRLAEQLRQGTTTAYGYVQRVLDHLAHGGYRYSEEPPPSAVPLASFLLGDKRGYCQQFSGAMALLLRMEGVPARVATGFSQGTNDRDTGEFVVHDTDAHSWVEAYIDPYGWVTFDPTPAGRPGAARSRRRHRRERLCAGRPARRPRRGRAGRRPQPRRREGRRRLAAAVDPRRHRRARPRRGGGDR